MMKTSIDHLPEHKQRELGRIVEILHEEFDDALDNGTAEFKKKGRILKIILFGSYARGDWVDEPHTMKGYRSDYDLLIVVNNRKLADFAYWYKAKDRLIRDRGIKTPTSFIVHSRREVNTALRDGQYFFTDIRRDGIVLYELDDEPLAEPNYSPPSHKLTFLRALAEERDRQLAEAWPRDQQRYRAWFNTLNEAYVKARYSKHYAISEEALTWLGERTAELLRLVEEICHAHLAR